MSSPIPRHSTYYSPYQASQITTERQQTHGSSYHISFPNWSYGTSTPPTNQTFHAQIINTISTSADLDRLQQTINIQFSAKCSLTQLSEGIQGRPTSQRNPPLLPSIEVTLPYLRTFEIYKQIMKFSEALVYCHYSNDFSFIPAQATFSHTLTYDDMTQNSKKNLNYLHILLEEVKEQCKLSPNQHNLIQSYVQMRDPHKTINTMNIEDILFLFGIYLADTMIIYNIDYQVETNNNKERIPSSSLARACFFRLPISLIPTFIPHDCNFDNDLYTLILKYGYGREELLRLVTQGKHQPLENTIIINSIIEERAWDLLKLAIMLGAKPVLTDTDPNQTLSIIRKISMGMCTRDANRFIDKTYHEFAKSIIGIANEHSMTHDEKSFWQYFISKISILKQT